MPMRISPRLSLVLLLVASALQSQVRARPLEHIDGLGSLDFPTSSTSAPARAAFLRGMLLLHVFEYADAELAFRQAEALDPGFALAYWGEAMCATHPVWNQQDMARGRAALAKLGPTPEARAAKAPTARERGYLETAELLYGEGDKPGRDQRVEQAFARLAQANPGDDEAKLFHALWLLGLGQGERQQAPFLQAADIARAAYRRNPDHPGAAHYWIHGMDDPAHAAGALEAAGSLAKIAPDAGHAQHMTAHIFMALGRWDDVVAANVNAERVVRSQMLAKGKPDYGCGHYSEWLEYAYFQQGRESDGMRVLRDCLGTAPKAIAWARAHPDQPYGSSPAPAFKARFDASMVLMRGMAMTESAAHRAEAASSTVDLSDVDALRGWAAFARGLQRAGEGNVAQARRHLVALEDAARQAQADPSTEPVERAQLAVMRDMLAGAIAQAAGDAAGARRLLDAADVAWDGLPFDFGPPTTIKPVHELHGDILLAQGNAKAALAQYELALKGAPQRRLSLRGRASALSALGDPAAQAAWAGLDAMLAGADAGLPDAALARACSVSGATAAAQRCASASGM
jgi:tetratricopeptide (TPR) repeat protein